MLSSFQSKRCLREEATKTSKALRKERDFNRAFHLQLLLGDTWNKRRGRFQTAGRFVK